MSRPSLCCALLLLAAAPARAQSTKLVEETWHAAYFEGARAGHVHTTVEQLGSGDDRLLRTTRAMHLSVRRYGKVAGGTEIPGHRRLGSDRSQASPVRGRGNPRQRLQRQAGLAR